MRFRLFVLSGSVYLYCLVPINCIVMFRFIVLSGHFICIVWFSLSVLSGSNCLYCLVQFMYIVWFRLFSYNFDFIDICTVTQQYHLALILSNTNANTIVIEFILLFYPGYLKSLFLDIYLNVLLCCHQPCTGSLTGRLKIRPISKVTV